jgi:hypothetical protein
VPGLQNFENSEAFELNLVARGKSALRLGWVSQPACRKSGEQGELFLASLKATTGQLYFQSPITGFQRFSPARWCGLQYWCGKECRLTYKACGRAIICLAMVQSRWFTTAASGLTANEPCLEAEIVIQRLSFGMNAAVKYFCFVHRIICLTQHHLLLFIIVVLKIDSRFRHAEIQHDRPPQGASIIRI